MKFNNQKTKQDISNNNTPSSFKLDVPNPCDKQYEDMQEVDGTCRFCTHCSTKVYDFTNCSEEDFLAIFKANNGKVCGLINATEKPSQPIHNQSFIFNRRRWTTWLVSLLAFIGFSSSSCKSSMDNQKVGLTLPEEQQENFVKGKISIIEDSTKTPIDKPPRKVGKIAPK